MDSQTPSSDRDIAEDCLASGAKPELLAPAGNWDGARAAVEAGADAIYFGLGAFNARMRADNFTADELPELMRFLHQRGVRGYLTLNTLVFQDELPRVPALLRQVMRAGVDAAIIQDVGICRLIRQLSPDFPIHASTQMTITSATGIRFARELGCQLVVMARECSIAELEKIQAEGQTPTMPLEVFVHGALCVAYSGQCLTSESLGGRSANRGECAQACRMTYDLYQDGKKIELGDRRYLLSPQDLMGLEAIPDLIRAGIASFKIEGRLKAPEYVASVTSAYRRAIDSAWSSGRNHLDGLVSETRYDLEMAFSRGLYSGWLRGIDNRHLVHARFGKKRGVRVGQVISIKRSRIVVAVASGSRLKEGDGVVFDQGRPDRAEQGGRIVRLHETKARGQVAIELRRGSVDVERIQRDDWVWKTSDPEYEKRWQRVAAAKSPLVRTPIGIRVTGSAGESMRCVACDPDGRVVEAVSRIDLEAARSQALDGDRLEKQLGRLGGTPFVLGRLSNELSGDLMLPVSELNHLRRVLVDSLLGERSTGPRWRILPAQTPCSLGPESAPRDPGSSVEWVVLIRRLDQLGPALEAGIRTIYCDFENPKDYRAAVSQFRRRYGDKPGSGQAPAIGSPSIFVAPPRIHKPGEDWILKQVQSSQPDGFLVRNFDHLEFYRGARLRGDFSLNVANALAAECFMGKPGMERVTPSYDLNVHQLEALVAAVPGHWLEITLHQHMPMFHMEHCVFCAFLSEGKDYRDCGRPCDRHEVALEDRVGQRHDLKADVGCRNTLYNGRAQTGAEYYQDFFNWGVRSFRLEFLSESPSAVGETIQLYDQLRSGAVSGDALWRELKLTRQLGVTRGTVAPAS